MDRKLCNAWLLGGVSQVCQSTRKSWTRSYGGAIVLYVFFALFQKP